MISPGLHERRVCSFDRNQMVQILILCFTLNGLPSLACSDGHKIFKFKFAGGLQFTHVQISYQFHARSSRTLTTVNLVMVPLIRCFTCYFYSVCGETTCLLVQLCRVCLCLFRSLLRSSISTYMTSSRAVSVETQSWKM